MQRNIRVVAVGAGLRLFGLALILPFLSLFLRNVLDLGYLTIGLIALAIGAAQVPATFLGGMLGDRLGRRSVYVGALALEGVLIAGLAWAMSERSFLLVVSLALLAGSAGSLGGPATAAYIADFTQASERTRAFTLQRVGHNAGFASGVALGGILVPLLGFPEVTGIAAGLQAGGVLVLAVLLEPSPVDRRRAGPQGALDPAPGGARTRTGAREVLGLLARDRPFLELCLAGGLISLVVSQWGVTFVLFANTIAAVPYGLLGLGLALNGIVVVFGQSLTTEAMLGRRHTSIAVLGLVAYAAGFLLFAFAATFREEVLVTFFLSILIITLGENLLAIPSSTLPSNLAPSEGTRSSYNGGYQTAGATGGLFAVLLGGAALAGIGDPLLLWSLLVLPAVPAALLLGRLDRTLPSPANRA
jgi:MFS family permease